MADSLKVLITLPSLGFGGVENHCISLARGLVSSKERTREGSDAEISSVPSPENVEVTVVSGGGAQEGELCVSRITSLELPIGSKGITGMLLAQRKLRKILREGDYDILHSHSRIPAWQVNFAQTAVHRKRRSSKRPQAVIVTAHSLYSPHLLSSIMARGDQIIAVSERVRDHLIRKLGARAERVRVIHNGLDPKLFEGDKDRGKVRAELGATGETVIIGSASRLSRVKRLDLWLGAVKEVSERVSDSLFVIVGDGSERDRLTRLAEKIGIGGKVRFLGFRNDLLSILSAMDTFLFTSSAEGFGLALLEAAFAGIPVVTTNVGAAPEIFPSREFGIVANDDRELLPGLLELARDRSLRKEIGERTKERAQSIFTLDRMVSLTLDCYQEALR